MKNINLQDNDSSGKDSVKTGDYSENADDWRKNFERVFNEVKANRPETYQPNPEGLADLPDLFQILDSLEKNLNDLRAYSRLRMIQCYLPS